MVEQLKTAIAAACKDLFGVDVQPALERTAEQFGDYATNAALQLAGQLNKNPRDIAVQLAASLQKNDSIAKAEAAGPGFINLALTDEALLKLAANPPAQSLDGQEILVEFGDPNPFKQMHIGHLYSYIVGDAIASLLEAAGAKVKRLSYHGDVGRQVAMAIYGLQEMLAQNREDGEDSLSAAYVYGNQKYEEDPVAKAEIDKINQHIYAQDDSEINELHKKGVQLSFEAFDKILNLLSIHTDKRYLESQTTPIGMRLVEENLGKVFSKSQGAIIYEGEKAGLHTRVFITSNGLPTYETKDLGLVVLKEKDYPEAVRSIVITANEQNEYFKVMLAALGKIKPDLAQKTTHLSHGFLSLTSGKMNSREGNVYKAMDLLLQVKDAVHAQYPDSPAKKPVTFAAVKYAFLKHRLGSDIVVDIKESVGLEGNSGPYLQYAYARARSILAKSTLQGQILQDGSTLQESERSLVRKIGEYPEVVAKATAELMPHHIGSYLYELAQNFNRFYESSRIIGDPREAMRLGLVKNYSQVLKNGLNLLGIEAPEKM